MGGNILVKLPSRQPLKILDVGTGSGTPLSPILPPILPPPPAPPMKPLLLVGVDMYVGRWAIEVADDYPNAQVIGMDLSPMQPTYVPQNCEFIVGDLTESLADFNDGSFDLVHSRYSHSTPCIFLPRLRSSVYFSQSATRSLTDHFCYALMDRYIHSGVTKEEWPKYIKEVYRLLKPGGYAQICEPTSTLLSEDGKLPNDAPIAEVRPCIPSLRVFRP